MYHSQPCPGEPAAADEHMRILLLTHRLPYPPNKGDKIRSFNLLRHLSRRHEVYVVSPIDDARDLSFVPDVKKFAREVLVERIGQRSRALTAVGSLLRRSSITVQHFYSQRLASRMDELLDKIQMDAFFCFSSPMAEYLFNSRHWEQQIARGKKVMDLINVDSYKWRQYAEQNRGPKAWIYGYEANRLAEYETRIARQFDRLYVVSEQEKKYLPKTALAEKCDALSNGVDLEYFKPSGRPGADASSPTLVFTGVMDYWPNIDGVKWFVERIFPAIRAAVPQVRFVIVGSRPTNEVRALAKLPGVEVTGFVEDVRDYVSAASVCVVPLRIARGIQNKVLEAMAMGKAVISTRQALEGIRAEEHRDIIAADDEAGFAAAVVELLRDESKARNIGAHARSCVESNYSWDDNLRQLDVLLEPSATAFDRPLPSIPA